MNGASATPAALRVIRLALLAGVVMFGSVVYYLTREGPVSDVPNEATRSLSFALMGLAAASLAALFVVRSIRDRAASYDRRSALTVVGWAVGEAPALLGGVVYLLTASPLPYLTGLSVLIASFLMIPVPEES
jgi:hypothetical protein